MIAMRIEGRVRVTELTGAVSAADLREHMRRVFEDPTFDPSLDSLVDMRGLEGVAFDSADVGEIDREWGRRTEGVQRRLAFVTGSPVALGYARSFQLQHASAGDVIELFDDVASARRWLGLD
jgi:hypothetical protein